MIHVAQPLMDILSRGQCTVYLCSYEETVRRVACPSPAIVEGSDSILQHAWRPRHEGLESHNRSHGVYHNLGDQWRRLCGVEGRPSFPSNQLRYPLRCINSNSQIAK